MPDQPKQLIQLEVNGTKVGAFSVRGRMTLSTPFVFEVSAFSLSGRLAVADLLGKTAKLTLQLPTGDGNTLVVNGVCGSVESTVSRGTLYVLQVEPETAPLALGQDLRVYQNKSPIDVIKDVLGRGAVQHVRWATTGTYDPRTYLVQYRESDWAFIERVCAAFGIYYYFEMKEDATTLVFCDDSTSAPDIQGTVAIPCRDESSMAAGGDALTRVDAWTAFASDAVRITDYSPDKPKLKLDSTAQDATDSYEVYDYHPGRFTTPAAGDARSKQMLEGLRARRWQLGGGTGTLRMRPGCLFQLTEHPVESLDGKYLCTQVEIEVFHDDLEGRASGGRAEAGADAVRIIRWQAIPAATPFRVPPADVFRCAGGPQTAIVSGPAGHEIYTEDSGGIRAQFYWDRVGQRDQKPSTPMRVGQLPMVGSMVRPRIGWDQLVEFQEGDVDQPFIESHLYDGLHPVPYKLPDNMTRSAWQTATSPGGGTTNEFRFEDKKGSEEIFINASRDMKITVGDSGQHAVGNNHTRTVGSNQTVSIGNNDMLTVGADQTVSVGASESLSVSGGRTVDVKGSLSSTIGASRTLTAITGHSCDADGGRTATIGGSQMSLSALGVNRLVLGSYSHTVGGAWMALAAKGVANTTLGAGAETIGGAKVQAAGGGITLNTKGAGAETVGGAYVIAAGGNITETAGGTLAITVGGAFAATTPEIDIEAESEIVILCGGSSLTIKSGSIELKAPAIPVTGPGIDAEGGTVNHN